VVSAPLQHLREEAFHTSAVAGQRGMEEHEPWRLGQ
jgi:hypothetical protein